MQITNFLSLGVSSLSSSDVALLLPVLAIHGILVIVAIVDLIRNWNKRNVKVLWILLVVMLQIIGPVIYFIFGRGKKDE